MNLKTLALLFIPFAATAAPKANLADSLSLFLQRQKDNLPELGAFGTMLKDVSLDQNTLTFTAYESFVPNQKTNFTTFAASSSQKQFFDLITKHMTASICNNRQLKAFLKAGGTVQYNYLKHPEVNLSQKTQPQKLLSFTIKDATCSKIEAKAFKLSNEQLSNFILHEQPFNSGNWSVGPDSLMVNTVEVSKDTADEIKEDLKSVEDFYNQDWCSNYPSLRAFLDNVREVHIVHKSDDAVFHTHKITSKTCNTYLQQSIRDYLKKSNDHSGALSNWGIRFFEAKQAKDNSINWIYDFPEDSLAAKMFTSPSKEEFVKTLMAFERQLACNSKQEREFLDFTGALHYTYRYKGKKVATLNLTPADCSTKQPPLSAKALSEFILPLLGTDKWSVNPNGSLVNQDKSLESELLETSESDQTLCNQMLYDWCQEESDKTLLALTSSIHLFDKSSSNGVYHCEISFDQCFKRNERLIDEQIAHPEDFINAQFYIGEGPKSAQRLPDQSLKYETVIHIDSPVYTKLTSPQGMELMNALKANAQDAHCREPKAFFVLNAAGVIHYRYTWDKDAVEFFVTPIDCLPAPSADSAK